MARRLQRVAGIALAAVVAFTGVVLVVTAWGTQRQVETARGLLVRGQAGIWYDAVRAVVPAGGRSAEPSVLQTLVDERFEDGLRYVAIVDVRGRVVVEGGAVAGQPLTEAELRASVGEEPVRVGDRVRVVFRGTPRRRVRRPGRPALSSPVVVEFVDDTARDLELSARTSLWAGGLAALGCFIAAALLLRYLRRRESILAEAAHAQRLASLGQMSATMAHELRNPLASLKGNAQLLARMLPDGERARGKADLVVGEAIRLESLTNDLLEFARTGMLSRTPVLVNDLLHAAATEVAASTIHVQVADPSITHSLDASRMRQVLTNLLRNAVEVSPSAVEVTATHVDGELQIVIRDHGPGIAEADAERIFEPFVSRRAHGTGLGLAVARRLVELHGGTLVAANAAGGGAQFTVKIPS